MWNLGLLGAAGGLGEPVGIFDLLQSETLSATTQTISLSNISNYSSDYEHLQVRLVGRSTSTTSYSDSYNITFNGVGGTSYSQHNVNVWGDNSLNSGYTSSAANFRLGGLVGAYYGGSSFGSLIMEISDPFNTSKNTSIRYFGGHGQGTTSENEVTSGVGLFANTSNINSISMSPFYGGSFVAGTRIGLYGYKGVSS